jgi:hypothetical protein
VAAQRSVFQLSTVWPAVYEVRFAFSASEWKFLHTFGPSALSFQLSTVWPAVLTRELQFLPQRGNLCSVLGPSFWAKGQIVWPHRHFCVATLHFLPQSGNFVRSFGLSFGPSARFWALDFDSSKIVMAERPLEAGKLACPVHGCSYKANFEVVNTTGAPWAWP